jgi:hypothetical protein
MACPLKRMRTTRGILMEKPFRTATRGLVDVVAVRNGAKGRRNCYSPAGGSGGADG